MNSLNPKAVVRTTVPSGSSSSGIPSISNTKSGPITASEKPQGSFVESDLAYLRSLGPGPLPWEETARLSNPSLKGPISPPAQPGQE